MSDKELLLIIKNHPHGIGIDDIRNALPQTMPKRTLQRHVSRLVQLGDIQRIGKGPSTAYQLAQQSNKVGESATITYSTAAKRLKQQLHQPQAPHKRIVYQRDFLYRYKPNSSYYLPQNIRAHLQLIGQQENGKQPAATFARTILNRLLIDLSWNSSRLEGNTYSLLETQRLLILGKESREHTRLEAQMILNHKSAIEFLIDLGDSLAINRFTVLNLHALLADNLLNNPEAIGRIRKIPVAIGKTNYQPLNIPQLLEENFNYILDTAAKINDPFEQAFFLMVQLPYLQPFEDVNKRVSRLAANIPFIKHNCCPLSFVELSNRDYIDGILGIYELNDISAFRDMFIWSYERSVQRYTNIRDTLPEPDPFRLRYRSELITVVSAIVTKNIQAEGLSVYIKEWMTQYITEIDHTHFKEIIESELINLREGNIARYRITLDAFNRWYSDWSK